MTGVEAADLAAFLAEHPPFDSLGPEALDEIARAARVERFDDGALIHDAFASPTDEVFVVVAGQVDLLWNDARRSSAEPDEILEPGAVFGFSAMLTERSIGPRAVAAGAATVARIPASLAGPAFASRQRGTVPGRDHVDRTAAATDVPSYSSVDELIEREPLVVDADTAVGEVARRMTERGVPAVVDRIGAGQFGLVTDSVLRARVLVDGRPATTPAREIMDTTVPTVEPGDSAAEALMLLLERDAEFLLVTDRAGELRGVVCPRDFAISPITVGVSLHEQLRRATSIEELATFAGRVPPMLGDLLSRGLAAGRVIAVYSGFLDTIIRRAIGLVFARHPELSVDAFTWLSLGSNGRREAVLSSDVDSAVAFDDAVDAEHRARPTGRRSPRSPACWPRQASARTTTARPRSRPCSPGRTPTGAPPAEQWLAAPAEHNGAMMTSLLVDGRPIHGDPGLPAVSRVFSDLREHPGTMRLLLRESLSYRAKLRSAWFPARRPETFDIKTHALLPVVNIARWAALSVGSAVLPTTERLRAASGSAMLPADSAAHADRGVRRAAAAAAALPAPAVPGRGAADRRRHAEVGCRRSTGA